MHGRSNFPAVSLSEQEGTHLERLGLGTARLERVAWLGGL